MLRVQQHQMEWKAASPWARLRNASGSENDVRQDDRRRKLSEQTDAIREDLLKHFNRLNKVLRHTPTHPTSILTSSRLAEVTGS